MKYKVGDKVRAIVSDPRVANTIVTITGAEKVMDIQYYIVQDTNGEKWGFTEDELEPVAIRSVLFPNVEYVFNEKQAEELAERLNKELAGRFNAFQTTVYRQKTEVKIH